MSMYDHFGLRVRDVDASVRFYEAVLTPLGHVLGPRGDTYVGFGPADAPAFWLHPEKDRAGSGCHIAFKAPSRASVDGFHAAGLKAGAKDNGAPGIRADYSPTYYAAFLIDPDGNNVEAVCTK